MKASLGAKTLGMPNPVWVIGSYNQTGRPNIMTAAWCGICCSQPPCIAVSLRKATYTYGNLMARKAFTANIPSENYAVQTDYVGMVSGRDTDKFETTGLTPVRSTIVDAPYINEFPLILECRVIHVAELGLHTQFVGEIMDVKAEETVLSENDPDLLKIKPIVFSPGSRHYYGIGPVLGPAFKIGKQ
ncbi:MAG: flavin reductase family protein [Deltaproteobacteria bacterium]|nr:flavin reductase family protein [Deltaproteobacteria bacterium]